MMPIEVGGARATGRRRSRNSSRSIVSSVASLLAVQRRGPRGLGRIAISPKKSPGPSVATRSGSPSPSRPTSTSPSTTITNLSAGAPWRAMTDPGLDLDPVQLAGDHADLLRRQVADDVVDVVDLVLGGGEHLRLAATAGIGLVDELDVVGAIRKNEMFIVDAPSACGNFSREQLDCASDLVAGDHHARLAGALEPGALLGDRERDEGVLLDLPRRPGLRPRPEVEVQAIVDEAQRRRARNPGGGRGRERHRRVLAQEFQHAWRYIQRRRRLSYVSSVLLSPPARRTSGWLLGAEPILFIRACHARMGTATFGHVRTQARLAGRS